MRVLITDLDLGDPALETSWLEEELGADVTVASCVTEQDVLDAVAATDPDALLVQWAPITAAVVSAAPNVKVISRLGIGIDMIDTVATEAAGISVRNVPHYCTEEVATHAVALAMTLVRRIPQLDAQVRAGMWAAAASAPLTKRISQCTIGLIGYGRIGQLVAAAFRVWGATVVVYDPYLTSSEHELVSLDVLLERSDIISVHAPLTDATYHLLDAAAFAKMKRQPILVNTSRGPIIDTAAIPAALAAGQLGGVGLDVYEAEPLDAASPLRDLENTVLTPHSAWCSVDALPALRRGAVDNIVEFYSDSAVVTP